jgi:hypothetical protein
MLMLLSSIANGAIGGGSTPRSLSSMYINIFFF